MSAATGLRLLLAHEQRLFGECLSAALADEPEVGDVHLVTDARLLPAELAAHRPDVVVLRPGTPRSGTAALCSAIKETRPETRVIVIDETPDPDLLLACIEAGADGYTTFEDTLGALAATVCRVEQGETVVPPLMLGGLLDRLIQRRRLAQQTEERFAALTPREHEVLQLLVAGHDHHGIAHELVVSPHTARTHIQNVLHKLEVHSRVEAVALAVTSGWIEPRTLPDRKPA